MKKTENSKIKEDKNKTKKVVKNKKKKKIWKRLLIAVAVIIIIIAGIGAGLIFGLMGGKYAITKEDLIIELSNSVAVDSNGEVISVLNGVENRKIISKSEMGEYLPKAFVAIEDKRFYSHNGVDLKRSMAAIFSFVLHRGESSVGGGSTITQQLVKNITNEKEDSGLEGAIRKIKEMIRAYQVENLLSKDQILENYMNIIFLGGNVKGVSMASQYYFSKDAADLSLAESAFIAGITHGPNGYNPFGDENRTEKIAKRTKTVLKLMKEQGKINTEEEYNKAVEEVEKGLNFKKGTIVDIHSYSSHTEAMIKQIVNQLVSEKGMDPEYAETYLLSNGFTIYSTEVSNIQDEMEKEYAKNNYQVKTTVEKVVKGEKQKVKEAAQSAMVIIDHKTGNVVGAVGTLGEKITGNLNRVNAITRQPGSSIKPIAVYGPALEENVITPASVYEDKALNFPNWNPRNAYSGFKGLMNMRQALKVSSNTVAIQVLQDLTPTKALEYLKKLGLEHVNDQNDNTLPLALGVNAVSPLEMAAAYATIANDGEYITPTFYTKVVDSNGNVIIETKQEKRRVFSEGNAYILKQLLTEPIKAGGTATICKVSGIETAAKTGTTQSNHDKWLCGFTPYYTAATWYGYDTQTPIPSGARTNASIIWKNVMGSIHKGLKSANFEKPKNIVSATVCKDSGLLITDVCKNDPRGSRAYTEYFVKGAVPTKTCTTHVEAEVCKISGELAGEFCVEKEKKIFIDKDKNKKEEETPVLPENTCSICKADSILPVITLKGESTINLKVNDVYTEFGATATDNTDGDITNKIIIDGKVNTNVAGTYKITYTVSDTVGNVATVNRTIIVSAQPESPTPPENSIITNP